MPKKQILYPILLTAAVLVLLFFSVPAGSAFGSEVDWLCQHVSIAEHFRQNVYETGSLLIDYSDLGAGSNFYMFSYYGYLRPDILIGCLLPMVPMKTILIVYAVLGIIASVNLCYFWLKKQSFAPFFCFLGGMLLACASCFFQAHRQLMFVNYLPWLFLALLAIDYFLKRGRIVPFVLSALMFILHSFYFSISCFAVCFIYLLYRSREKRTVFYFIIGCGIAVALAAVLLAPTALVLLEHTKDNGSGASLPIILAVNPTLRSLLYSGYSCGLTLVSLYGLFLGIKHRPTRGLGIAVFCAVFLNIVPFILNGGLYIKSKILIPFVPLVILICITVLAALYQQTLKHSLWLLLLSFVPLFFQSFKWLVILDAVFLLLFFLFSQRAKGKLLPYLSLLVVPPLLFVQTNRTESFVPAEDPRQAVFTEEEMKQVYQNTNARFDQIDTDEAIATVNLTPVQGMKKSTMYSSSMNTEYSAFYYDLMKNPISINNRVALLAAPNPFFEYLMGIQYLQTTNQMLPDGYTVKLQKGENVLAENDSVLPTAYVSYNLMGKAQFDTLSYPETLDAMTNYTIVSNAEEIPFQSEVTPFQLDYSIEPSPDGLETASSDGVYDLHVKQETELTASLTQPIPAGHTLILTFEVENPDGRAVIISCNGIRNKLSADSAAYPNHNHQFTYYLSSSQPIDTLDFTFSKGDYQISNIKAYLYDNAKMGNEGITPLSFQETKGSTVLQGSAEVQKDGYFVTSLPIQNGYQAFVDGKEVEIETVNTAFVGFPITKGSHQIQITFTPPGRNLGIAISLLALAVLAVGMIWEIRRTHREKPALSSPAQSK